MAANDFSDMMTLFVIVRPGASARVDLPEYYVAEEPARFEFVQLFVSLVTEKLLPNPTCNAGGSTDGRNCLIMRRSAASGVFKDNASANCVNGKIFSDLPAGDPVRGHT